MTVHSCIVLFLLQYLICIVVDQTHFKWQCCSATSSLQFVCQDYKQISIQDTLKFWARQGQPWLMFVVSLVKEIHLFAFLPRDWEEKLTPLSYLCVKYEARVWYLALGKKAKKKASQNIRLCNVQVSLLLYKHDMTGEIHLGIPINDLMWAVALNITWIYLFSVSVFLSLSFLYCPLRICWLWWVNPLISVSPSSSSSSSEKKNLFVLIPTARRQLSCPTCLLYIPPKCCCTVCQFCTVHPCRLSSSNISFSSVDVLSLETPL